MQGFAISSQPSPSSPVAPTPHQTWQHGSAASTSALNAMNASQQAEAAGTTSRDSSLRREEQVRHKMTMMSGGRGVESGRGTNYTS